MKRPLVGLALVFAAGIWAGSWLDWPPWPVWVAAALLCAVGWCWPRQPVLWALVFVTGIAGLRAAVTPSSPRDLRRLAPLRGQNAGLRGVVVSAPDAERFQLRLSAVQLTGEWEPAIGTVLLSGRPVEYGDEVECSALLRVPTRARNPGTFDQAAWLARQGIYFTATVRSGDVWQVRGRGRGNPLTAVALRLRTRMERAVWTGLEDRPELAGVLAAIVIGQRAEMPPETYADFQRTGVFHVFSVSGLHVGMVALLLVGLLRLAQVPRRASALVAIPVLLIYVWATGARPGAVRSWLMAAVWLGAWTLVRPADLLNGMAAAALAILVWDPQQLFDGGFVLSFGAVAAIVVLTPRWEPRLTAVVAGDPFLPGRYAPWWRRLLAKPLVGTMKLASCSAAAWLGLLPLVAVYFHLFTPIAVVANLVVVPVISLIMALGLASLLTYPVWPWLAATFNNANFFLLAATIRAVAWLEQVPLGHLFVQAPPGWLVAGYYAVGLALLSSVARRYLRRWWPVAAAPALGGLVFVAVKTEPAAELTVLDVPAGAALFVDLPGQTDDWLVDGGGRRAVLPFLRGQGVDRLGGVVLSCKDQAHVTGLDEVLAEVPVGQVVLSDAAARSPAYWRWRADVNARRLPVRTLRAGDQWNIQDLRITVLNPPRDPPTARSDDNALVLQLEYGATRVLWLSDVGATVERRLVAEHPHLRCAVLVKGGHSFEPSATDALLAATRPEYVVQVVNDWPSRRYPDASLRQRVEANGARLLRTDEDGAVVLRLTRQGYTLRTCTPDNRR